MTDIFKQALELTEQAVKDQVATSDTPRVEISGLLEPMLLAAASREQLEEAVQNLRAQKFRLQDELAAAQRDAERYRWLRARWDAGTDEDIEQHSDAMNSPDPDAHIDAALKAAKRKGER